MKSLTIRNPWAAAIAHHGKTTENRTWATRYRGPLAIHAGSRLPSRRDLHDLAEWIGFLGDCDPLAVLQGAHALSAVVAVAELTDVCSRSTDNDRLMWCTCGPWAVAGQHHWRLSNVRPLVEPVSAKGQLGLWDLPREVEAAVRAQLRQEVAQ